VRGTGRGTFAAILLLIAGTLNIIYGIGALDSANIFANDTRYIFTDLNTMGWVLIVLGVIQLTAGVSLIAGNAYGRVIGIRRQPRSDKRPAVGRRTEPMVVAGRLLPVRVDRLWHRRPRGRRARAGDLSPMARSALMDITDIRRRSRRAQRS
jgi:hypothetical protein